MKYVLLTTILIQTLAFAGIDHYPEERTYTAQDRGYTQYGTPSLYGTGKYVLTFDDGPHPKHTPKVLDLLKKYNAKATFFIILKNVNDSTFPLVKRMLDEGHIVASHGMVHDNSNNIPKEEWKTKVKESFVQLKALYQKAGHRFDKFYYRFPYAAYGTRKDHHHLNTLKEISRELMDENCIHFVFWDHDTGDWIPDMSAKDVFQNFRATNEGGLSYGWRNVRNSRGRVIGQRKVPGQVQATSGGVVLQHDIQEKTIAGTQLILQYVQDQNLEIVPLDSVEEFRPSRKCQMR